MTMHDPAAQPPCTLDAPAAVEIAVQTLHAPENDGDWDAVAALLRRIAAGKGTPVSGWEPHCRLARNAANTRAVIARDRGEGGPLCVRALACRH